MTNPEIYGWQSVCVRAVLETDDSLMMGRICKAISAIDQRRLSPLENNSDEDCALNDAEAGIKALITERTDLFVRNFPPGHGTIGL
jgi:hypothetical protein